MGAADPSHDGSKLHRHVLCAGRRTPGGRGRGVASPAPEADVRHGHRMGARARRHGGDPRARRARPDATRRRGAGRGEGVGGPVGSAPHAGLALDPPRRAGSGIGTPRARRLLRGATHCPSLARRRWVVEVAPVGCDNSNDARACGGDAWKQKKREKSVHCADGGCACVATPRDCARGVLSFVFFFLSPAAGAGRAATQQPHPHGRGRWAGAAVEERGFIRERGGIGKCQVPPPHPLPWARRGARQPRFAAAPAVPPTIGVCAKAGRAAVCRQYALWRLSSGRRAAKRRPPIHGFIWARTAT